MTISSIGAASSQSDMYKMRQEALQASASRTAGSATAGAATASSTAATQTAETGKATGHHHRHRHGGESASSTADPSSAQNIASAPGSATNPLASLLSALASQRSGGA